MASAEDLFSIKYINQNVLQINENYYDSWNKANLYLILQDQESIMIDMGTGIFDPVDFLLEKKIIEKQPKLAIATHIHFDHCGGHKYFDNLAMHYLDAEHIIKPRCENF